jgi:outer membrane protein OmpA-like peptidoglycan-associated protein
MQRLNILLITIFLFFSAYDSHARAPEKRVFEPRVNPKIGLTSIQIPDIYFKRGKSALLLTLNPWLKEFVDFVKEHSEVRILLEGHTDNQEDPKHNMELSENRAKVVKKYLVEHGIADNRIELKGYGDTKPLNSQGTEALRKLNRRVEISRL